MNDITCLDPNTAEPFAASEAVENMGHVYALYDADRQICKVGSTVDAKRRLRTIITQGCVRSNDSWVSKPISNQYEVEQLAHQKLGDKHLQNEWFKCDISEAMCAINEAISEVGQGEPKKRSTQDIQKFAHELAFGKSTDNFTDWFFEDSPSVAEWFEKNGYSLDIVGNHVFVSWFDENGERQEMTLELFGALLVGEAIAK